MMMIENPWEVIARPETGWNVRRVSAEHQPDFYWARDSEDNYLLLFRYSKLQVAEKDFPDLAGIEINKHQSDEGVATIAVKLVDQNAWDIFHPLCLDLVSATVDCPTDGAALQTLLLRLQRWHLFLRKKGRRILSEAEQKGLLAELLFLRDHVLTCHSPHDALNFWQGPHGAPQDFNIGTKAIEVKCKSGTSQPKISISSPEQMSAQLPELFLFVATLGHAPKDSEGAISLPGIVKEIEGLIGEADGSALVGFDDKLMEAGYMYLPEYDEHNFMPSSYALYRVVVGFPRLVPEDIPEGVTDVRYSIELKNCLPFRVELESLKGGQ